MIGPLPDPSIVFDVLIADADEERATARFIALVSDVVGIVHPDAHAVVVDSAMWGTGVHVAEFGAGGRARVWQAVVGFSGLKATGRERLDEMLGTALVASEQLGYQLKSWTLAIPRDLDSGDLKAWHSWAKATKKTSNVTVDLWTASILRRRLLSPEGEVVRRVHLGAATAALPRTVQQLEDAAKYDDTLFVRQLREARVPETFSAKEAFFNAEVMNREVEDKNVQTELDLLREWRMFVHATWADVFNDACQRSAELIPPGVLPNVSDAIREDKPAYSTRMRASPIHGVGIMHQAVDAGEAGWVRDWRQVAYEHGQERALSLVAGTSEGDAENDH